MWTDNHLRRLSQRESDYPKANTYWPREGVLDGLMGFSMTGIRAPPPKTLTQSLLLRGWPTMRNNSLLEWVAKPWTNKLRKTAVRISQSSTAKPGWFSSPAALDKRIREAMPGEKHMKPSIKQFLNNFENVLSLFPSWNRIHRFVQFTWPLSRRSVGLNRLVHADSSDELLLRQQHTLIHSSCEIVHMAAGDSRDKRKKQNKHTYRQTVMTKAHGKFSYQ